jgi:3-phenylpropionate/trans-cinnamate dioxygenase ferredoxin component
MADYVRVCRVSDIADPGKAVFEVDEHFVVVFHIGGSFYALEDCCTHDGGELSGGQLDGLQIACPRHGARFDVCTGKALTMPATANTPSHEVKIDGDGVYVKIRE